MTVNNIAPGKVLTPFNQEAIDDPEFRDQQVQSIPLKRAAQPEEIGELAGFLASSAGDYVTGAMYVMDGGLLQVVGQGACHRVRSTGHIPPSAHLPVGGGEDGSGGRSIVGGARPPQVHDPPVDEDGVAAELARVLRGRGRPSPAHRSAGIGSQGAR